MGDPSTDIKIKAFFIKKFHRRGGPGRAGAHGGEPGDEEKKGAAASWGRGAGVFRGYFFLARDNRKNKINEQKEK